MYVGGVKATVTSREGNDVSSVQTAVDEAASIVKVTVPDSLAKGTTFEVIIESA